MAHRLSSYANSILGDGRIAGSNRMPRSGDPTRVYWSLSRERDTSSWTSQELLHQMRRSANEPERYAICIIEDITSDWMAYIGYNMDMRKSFFVSHFNEHWDKCSHRWHWAVGSEERQPLQDTEEDQQWRKVDGTYSFPSQPGTRISYYRLCETLYLFLVDRPPPVPLDQQTPPTRRKPRGRKRTHLRLKYSMLLCGLSLPGLFDQEHPTYDLFSVLKDSIKHQWLRDCLFVDTKTSKGRSSAVRAHPLVYMLTDAAWTHNLSLLTKEVKDISFNNVEKPHRNAILIMHELREDLDYLKAEVEKAVRYAPPALTNYFEATASSQVYQTVGSPLVFLEQMQRDAAALDAFLTNSLNLLLATIALRDSERADMLTWLAAVYVPLSFVTGIFGMNLRELSDPSPPVWLCLEVLGVVLLVTAAMVLLYKYGGRVVEQVFQKRRVDRGSEQMSGYMDG